MKHLLRLAPCFAAFLFGCGEHGTSEFEPGMEPQKQALVQLHEVSREEVEFACDGLPTVGCAVWEDAVCHVYVPPKAWFRERQSERGTEINWSMVIGHEIAYHCFRLYPEDHDRPTPLSDELP